jgi:hypothetical protein
MLSLLAEAAAAVGRARPVLSPVSDDTAEQIMAATPGGSRVVGACAAAAGMPAAHCIYVCTVAGELYNRLHPHRLGWLLLLARHRVAAVRAAALRLVGAAAGLSLGHELLRAACDHYAALAAAGRATDAAGACLPWASVARRA